MPTEYEIGEALGYLARSGEKQAAEAEVSYDMQGKLYKSRTGWILMSVPNALGRGCFDALNEPGAELPTSETTGQYNAHVSVFRPEELEKIPGGADAITERGHAFSFTTGPARAVVPDGWGDVAKCWFIEIRSPELEKLRKSYGLSALPNDGKYKFHCTFAIRRKGITQPNAKSKAASLIHRPAEFLKQASTTYAVRKSDIHGQGVFATRRFEPGDEIGLAMTKMPGSDKSYHRADLGQFVNHAKSANAGLREDDGAFHLVSLGEIASGSEITVDYEDAYKLLGDDATFENGAGKDDFLSTKESAASQFNQLYGGINQGAVSPAPNCFSSGGLRPAALSFLDELCFLPPNTTGRDRFPLTSTQSVTDPCTFSEKSSSSTVLTSFKGKNGSGIEKIGKKTGKTIAVDLDGTLAEHYEKFDPKKIMPPREGAREAMQVFRKAGHKIIIFTVRGDNKLTAKWLDEHKIPYDHINENPDQPPDASGKVIADLYVDDRATPGDGHWDEIKQRALDILHGTGLRELIDAAAEECEEPKSKEQAEAGNYRHGHCSLHGLDVTIETGKGMTRKGTDKNGKPWSITLQHHYGYIKRTESEADGDHIDVFLGPDPESEVVFIVDQHVDGKFDEHKCLLGFRTKADAEAGYLANYAKGWKGLGTITALTMPQFKEWIASGDTAKPLAGQKLKFKQAEHTYALQTSTQRPRRDHAVQRHPGPSAGSHKQAVRQRPVWARTICGDTAADVGGDQRDGREQSDGAGAITEYAVERSTPEAARRSKLAALLSGDNRQPKQARVAAAAPHAALPELRQAKAYSDQRKYSQKAKLLRKLIQASPQDWVIDQPRPRFPGITHRPTNFRYHLPRHALPEVLTAAAEPPLDTAPRLSL